MVSSYNLTHARISWVTVTYVPVMCQVSHASCLPSVTNTLVPYISVLMYTLPRDHGVSPTHSCRIMWLICIVPRVHGASQTHSCCIKCIRFKQFQSIPISCNWLRPIHMTHLILRHHQIQMESPRWHFCKHPHYLIRLISFELFVTITLPPLSCQWIEIIPYIKRFFEWIETLSLGGKLQIQNLLHIWTQNVQCLIIVMPFRSQL
jgi:hypothetical protein